jgi:hypothetical protein
MIKQYELLNKLRCVVYTLVHNNNMAIQKRAYGYLKQPYINHLFQCNLASKRETWPSTIV